MTSLDPSTTVGVPREKRWVAAAGELWETLLSLFYPEVCQICRAGEAGPREGYVCATCRNQPDGIEFIVPPILPRLRVAV